MADKPVPDAAGHGIGFRDKLYWRAWPGGLNPWHCFKRCHGGGFVSLCDRYHVQRSGRQACCRPPPFMRCGICDAREMERRGKEESLPESPDWKSALPD